MKKAVTGLLVLSLVLPVGLGCGAPDSKPKRPEGEFAPLPGVSDGGGGSSSSAAAKQKANDKVGTGAQPIE